MTIQQIYLGNMGDYFLQSVSLERDCSAVQTDRKRNAFFFNDTAPTQFYTLSLHDALPIFRSITATRFFARDLTIAAGKLFFENGVSLWASDGTTAGTVELRNFGEFNDPTVAELEEAGGQIGRAHV